MLIYKITNKINSKVYIGQTTKTLEERKATYLKEYRWSKKPRAIILAMRKYGIENFIFEVIHDNIATQEEMDALERYYIIEVYRSLIGEGGYNMERGGNGRGKHSVTTRQKISKAQQGSLNHMYGKNGELNPSSKKVLELTTGKTFGSACEAANELGVNFSHVCAVARGERGSTGGYVFRYLDEKNKPERLKNFARIKSLQTKQNILPEFLYLV